MTNAAAAALLELAVSVALDAGQFLREQLGEVRTAIGTKSTATDLVSEVDRAVEERLVGALRAARPDDAVLGEEGADLAGTSGVTWIVDPLDGTTNYVYRLPAFAVSVAAEHEGRTLAGVVYDPMREELFTATLGGGACCNDAPIHVSGCRELALALVATGFGYDRERRRHQAEVLTAVLPAVRDIRRSGAAALDWCALACGRVDAFYERGQQPWDYAAGALIAREAGAVVGGLHDEVPSPALAFGAAPAIAAELRALLAAQGADTDG